MYTASPIPLRGPVVLIGLLVLATLLVLAILLASTIEVVVGPLKITFRKRRYKRR
jgi:hypothetical protein